MIENQQQQSTVRGGNTAAPARKNKRMSITAKCGTRLKTIIFPIPDDFEAWMCEMRDNAQIEVEGGNAVGIRIEIFNYKEKF